MSEAGRYGSQIDVPVSGAVSVRLHHGGPQGAKPRAEVVADILAAIKERRA